MAVNLLNDKALNDYLIDLVWNGHGVPKILDGKSQQNLRDVKYLEENKDIVVRSILTQYVKHRMRNFLTKDERCPFLVSVSNRDDLPDWSTKILARGEKIYEFDATKMTEQMRHDLTTIRDFLYSAAESYVDKTVIAIKESAQKDKTKLPKVRLDYLKTSNEYDTFEKTLSAAEKWHERMAELSAKKAKTEKMYKESLVGTKFIMDLPNGMKAYQLITPEALDFESEYMGHCVGQGSYDKGVSDGSIKIYSIRDSNGEPHATLEVRGQDVYQCKGKSNKTPVQRYIPAVQGFVERQNLEIKHDIKNIGLIKQAGKYYSVYDLPDGFVVNGDLDFSGMDVSNVNLNIKVTGTLNLSETKNLRLPAVLDFSQTQEVDLRDADLSGVREIKNPSRYISLIGVTNLPAVLDFSQTKQVNLSWTDLSGVHEIKSPSESMRLERTKNLPAVLDFSQTQQVNLSGADLSGVREIKNPSRYISLIGVTNLPAVLDFSQTKEVDLSQTDLSGVREIKYPSEMIDLSYVSNFKLPPVLEFGQTKEVDLRGADLSGVREIKYPPEYISLIGVNNLPSVLDLSQTKKVDLRDADLSGVREIKSPSESMRLERTKNLPPVVDFSQTKEVDLSGIDLSGVREIKWPLEFCELDGDKLSSHLVTSYKLWKFKKAIKRLTKEIKDVTKKMQQKVAQKPVVQKKQAEFE